MSVVSNIRSNIGRRSLLGNALAGASARIGVNRANAITPSFDPDAKVMGTAAKDGVYVYYGKAWGQLVQETNGLSKTSSVISYRPTGGPNENIYLMHLPVPKVHLSMVTMGIAREAWFGKGEWTNGRRFQEMRAVSDV